MNYNVNSIEGTLSLMVTVPQTYNECLVYDKDSISICQKMVNEGLIKHVSYEKSYAMGGKKYKTNSWEKKGKWKINSSILEFSKHIYTNNQYANSVKDLQ